MRALVVILAAVATSVGCAPDPLGDGDDLDGEDGKADSAYGHALLLANAWIVDPDRASVVQASIIVRDGQIVRIWDRPPVDYEGEIVDLAGRWLIPALVDAHVHSWGNQGPTGTLEIVGTLRSARRALYTGVGAILDLFSAERQILEVRNEQRDGLLPPAADIYAAGALITCTGGHGTEYSVRPRIADTPAQGQQHVRELATAGVDLVKLVYGHGGQFPSMDRWTMEAIVAEARALGLATVVHIRTWQDAAEVVSAGATAITHVPAQAIPPDAAAVLAERGVPSIPTLTVHMDLAAFADDRSLLSAPLLTATVSPHVVDDYVTMDPSDPDLAARLEAQIRARDVRRRSILAMGAAGVTLLTGSDAGNLGVFQGYSVHREMALMVQAGLSSWQALRAGTVAPARFLGKRAGFQVGAEASFVVLGGSPVDDIANTERIEAVIHHGQIIDRDALLEE
jgi:imidazolonepropionase-like amidohydrolase